MPEKRFRVLFRFKDEATLRSQPIGEMDTGCTGGVWRDEGGKLALVAHVGDELLKKVKRARGVEVEILADLEEEAKKMKKEVGRGNRFTGDDRIPRGLGREVRDEGSREGRK